MIFLPPDAFFHAPGGYQDPANPPQRERERAQTEGNHRVAVAALFWRPRIAQSTSDPTVFFLLFFICRL